MSLLKMVIFHRFLYVYQRVILKQISDDYPLVTQQLANWKIAIFHR